MNNSYYKIVQKNYNRETLIRFIKDNIINKLGLSISTINYSNDQLIKIISHIYNNYEGYTFAIKYMNKYKGKPPQPKDILNSHIKKIIDSVEVQQIDKKQDRIIYTPANVQQYNKIEIYNIFKYFIDHVENINRYDVYASVRIIIELEEGGLTTKYYNFAVDTMRRSLEEFKKYIEDEEGGEVIGNDSKAYYSHYILRRAVKRLDFAIIERKKVTHDGEFFKYLNKVDTLDLTRYQIYNNVDDIDMTPCIIYALKMGGVEDDKLIILQNHFKNIGSLQKKQLKELAEIIDYKINLSFNGLTLYYNYHSKTATKIINLCLFSDHYFIDELTPYKLSDFNKATGKDTAHKTRQNHYITSSFLVKKLFDLSQKVPDKYLIKITDVLNIKKQKIEKDDTDILEYNEQLDILEAGENPKKKLCGYDFIFLDFETETKSGHHVAYCVSATKINIFYNEETKKDDYKIIMKDTFKGNDCAERFLKMFVSDNCIFCAHNLKYDYSFLMRYMFAVNKIERNGALMGGTCTYYNPCYKKTFNITLRDSYKMISSPLKSFTKIFKLTEEKEIMPYDLYTKENLNKITVEISEALKYIEEKDHKQFINNIDKWNLRKNETEFYHIEYSAKYCEIDVELLMKGYMIFREWIQILCKLDIIDFCTISSISHAYMLSQGVYNGCYQVRGNVKKFLNKFIVGGRCMTNKNKMWYIMAKTQALDGVSLYSSSMFLGLGFLIGKPKIIKEGTTYDDLKKYDGYFIKINVTQINKKLDFPILSHKNEDGVRIFSDDLGLYYVDKSTLEDLIEYQNIKFEIVEGYYFDEGRNEKVKEVIKTLFDERKKMKQQGNPIEQCYKMLLNSCYGKTILKDMNTEDVYIKGETEALYYCMLNNKIVNSMTKIYDCDIYKINRNILTDTNYTMPHVGVEILSYSKHIMNRIIILAQDLGIKIFYQDTDSMHIEYNKISLLADEYKKKYNSDLLGSNLGQFHNDLTFDKDLNQNKDEPHKDSELIAVESIYTGKKSYCDKIEYTTINNKKDHCFLYRQKGIPKDTLYNEVKKNYCDDALLMYSDLLFGREKIFDLLGNRPRFEFTKDQSYRTVTEFKRTIKYNCALDNIEFFFQNN